MKKFCLILCLLCLFTARAGAVSQEEYNALGLGEIQRSVPDDARDILGGQTIGDALDLDGGLKVIYHRAAESAGGFLRGGLKTLLLLFTAVTLCGVCASLFEEAGKGMEVVHLVGAIAVAVICLGDFHTLVGLGRETIETVDTFSKGLLAALAAAAACGGAPTASAARHMATILFSDVLITMISRILIPLVYAYIAAATADAAIGGGTLDKLVTFLKWLCGTLLGLCMFAFVIYLTVTGVLASGADALTIRTTKFAISGLVPVVGGIIGDAADTVIASARILRNAIGAFGMLVVVAVCAVPFLRLGIQYLTFKAAGAVCGTVADTRLSKLIDRISGAVGMMLGMTGSAALLFIISIVSTISAAGVA